MSKNMLIDSAHLEEVRVAIVDGEKLDRFDFEVPSKAQIKGNIYLAKVVRVEPSLQAVFVDYGSKKHGFLSFSEIHHDYFQIPVGDREDLEKHIQSVISEKASESGESEEELDAVELSKLRYQFYRRYKIQEVIKKRQIMLVQVTKEERGSKGAAITTYISLAGRYCVFMPNTAKGSGISRKITSQNDRKKLKKIVSSLHIENGSTVIRTAGVGRTKAEIKKDFDYLRKTWDEIRETTLKSTAPCLINEEASIIKRSIRDLYSQDVESIIVEGEEGYKIAKNFVKKLMPGHAKKVKLYDDKKIPLFSKYKINDQIRQIYSTRVDLPSGGYLIINTTEALISIDVNSGRATRERNISGTALKTNLEAAVEIARQCRLRDLAGLIVIDFIDMEEKGNNNRVEKCLREALREDKAKIQVGSISNFGLLEFSRQRLRSSITEANMIVCPHCNGIGAVWSNESMALQVLRKIEETCSALDFSEVVVTLSTDVALYLMNHKRAFIASIEDRGHSKIIFNIDAKISDTDFRIEQTTKPVFSDEEDDVVPRRKAKEPSKRDRTGKKKGSVTPPAAKQPSVEDDEAVDSLVDTEAADVKSTEETGALKRRNRNKRRRNRERQNQKEISLAAADVIIQNAEATEIAPPETSLQAPVDPQPENKKVFSVDLKKRRYGNKRARSSEGNSSEPQAMEHKTADTPPEDSRPLLDIPSRKKTGRRKTAGVAKDHQPEKALSNEGNHREEVAHPEHSTDQPASEKHETKRKKRTGWWQSLLKKPEE